MYVGSLEQNEFGGKALVHVSEQSLLRIGFTSHRRAGILVVVRSLGMRKVSEVNPKSELEVGIYVKQNLSELASVAKD